MDLSTEKRVLSDLIIAFGFSTENAKEVIHRFKWSSLSKEEEKCILHLINKDPFTFAQGKKDMPVLRTGTIKTLEHLNYNITQEIS